MGNKKVSRPKQFKLQHKEERTVIDSKQLKKASGSYEFNPNSNSTYEEVYKMSEYIERKEFEQFEKRIDDRFKSLESKIDDIPNRLSDKLQLALNEQMESFRKERKEDKKSIITWTLSGTSLIVAIAGLLAKLFI
ncbi:MULTISPECIES: hypothetical protein [Staphylococcus]|uniref:hypothetical protein n=1 Tax=Staphylococcus phage StB12 TaxID=1147042 RepID=UPI0002534CC3|nr:MULTISPECIES: hypothetical protein [Staphylococcus]YP_009130753.1 hypothetical protein I921_gp74 [Staphylococcus phage StB12]EUZ70125.1 hypothetical protein O552_00032 [Staphylococcus sp. M0480]MDU6506216.1 hypothetical protein [Staphylococcus sp.]OHO58648.1 hypothetical protein HMPREF2650_05355 [Staphylococcus sp. HMSC035F02]PZQ23064.1 MAG: hypothetical protein DI558_11245 [Corynebacterium propinquum]DAO20855.1 MAG TPA: Protein of unknown function (DUF1640) [Caudoviricetes sp.]